MVSLLTKTEWRETQLETPTPYQVPQSALGFLNYIRFVSMNCRAMPKTRLFEACALLHATQSATQQAYAEALMRCLQEALGTCPRLFAPGVDEISFDERWLIQVGLASAQGDDLSLRFLLNSRVAHEHRRLVAHLVHKIAACFSLD
ncbi:hypothetical protein ACG74X_16295 [Marivita sp. S0852]|uniref:hypothetical protein n=1 Tax=Marivita sp. S0852 TaxID=3373893 RepID=UPI00398276EC